MNTLPKRLELDIKIAEDCIDECHDETRGRYEDSITDDHILSYSTNTKVVFLHKDLLNEIHRTFSMESSIEPNHESTVWEDKYQELFFVHVKKSMKLNSEAKWFSHLMDYEYGLYMDEGWRLFTSSEAAGLIGSELMDKTESDFWVSTHIVSPSTRNRTPFLFSPASQALETSIYGSDKNEIRFMRRTRRDTIEMVEKVFPESSWIDAVSMCRSLSVPSEEAIEMKLNHSGMYIPFPGPVSKTYDRSPTLTDYSYETTFLEQNEKSFIAQMKTVLLNMFNLIDNKFYLANNTFYVVFKTEDVEHNYTSSTTCRFTPVFEVEIFHGSHAYIGTHKLDKYLNTGATEFFSASSLLLKECIDADATVEMAEYFNKVNDVMKDNLVPIAFGENRLKIEKEDAWSSSRNEFIQNKGESITEDEDAQIVRDLEALGLNGVIISLDGEIDTDGSSVDRHINSQYPYILDKHDRVAVKENKILLVTKEDLKASVFAKLKHEKARTHYRANLEEVEASIEGEQLDILESVYGLKGRMNYYINAIDMITEYHYMHEVDFFQEELKASTIAAEEKVHSVSCTIEHPNQEDSEVTYSGPSEDEVFLQIGKQMNQWSFTCSNVVIKSKADKDSFHNWMFPKDKNPTNYMRCGGKMD